MIMLKIPEYLVYCSTIRAENILLFCFLTGHVSVAYVSKIKVALTLVQAPPHPPPADCQVLAGSAC